jgi:hypothetical protein
MPLFSGSGKLTFEAFMYQFERTAGRKGWTGETSLLLLYLPLFEEKILDSLYLTIGNSDSLRLGYWLESGHLTDPGQIAEY